VCVFVVFLKRQNRFFAKFFFHVLGENTCLLQPALKSNAPGFKEAVFNYYFLGILDKAFEKFDTKNVVELVHLKDGLNIMELWHGDTLVFKDLAMTCTVQFMNYFLTKRKKHFTSIVGNYLTIHCVVL